MAIGFGVHYAKSTCNTESQSLCLSFDSATVEVGLNVKLGNRTCNFKRLVYNVAESFIPEILIEFPSVDCNVAFYRYDINASDC